MEKKLLRKKYKQARAAFDQETIEAHSIAIANQALQLDIWEQDYYHIFLPIQKQKEVDTTFLLHILQGKDKHILIPQTDFETKEMRNVLLTDNTLIRVNKYGIPQPTDGIRIEAQNIQVIFIPLLAYDCKGNRIGYGGGFYDRLLANTTPETLKIGLSFFEPEKLIAEEATDIPLDMCITPTQVYYFEK